MWVGGAFRKSHKHRGNSSVALTHTTTSNRCCLGRLGEHFSRYLIPRFRVLLSTRHMESLFPQKIVGYKQAIFLY